jgi:hypothetical protein
VSNRDALMGHYHEGQKLDRPNVQQEWCSAFTETSGPGNYGAACGSSDNTAI